MFSPPQGDDGYSRCGQTVAGTYNFGMPTIDLTETERLALAHTRDLARRGRLTALVKLTLRDVGELSGALQGRIRTRAYEARGGKNPRSARAFEIRPT